MEKWNGFFLVEIILFPKSEILAIIVFCEKTKLLYAHDSERE